MYTWKKRLLAAILAGCMSIGLMTPALAVEGEGTQPTTTPEVTTSVAPTDEVDPSFSVDPTAEPTAEPTEEPAETPTTEPTETPAETPSSEPTETPAETPSSEPTETPAETPSSEPTETPAETPTTEPTETPAETPTTEPTETPAETPTTEPTESPEITEIPEETIPGGALPGDNLEAAQALLAEMQAMDPMSNDYAIRDYLRTLTEEEWNLLELVLQPEEIENLREYLLIPDSEIVTDSSEANPYTGVGPIFTGESYTAQSEAILQPMQRMLRAMPLSVPQTRSYNDVELAEGLIANKTASQVGDLFALNITAEAESNIVVNTVPCDIVLVLDVSGSMNDGGRLDSLKTSVYSFLDVILANSPNSRVAIVTYSDNAEIVAQLSNISSNIDSLKSKVSNLKARGATYSNTGLQEAYNILSSISSTAPEYDNARAVIMFTDGIPGTGLGIGDWGTETIDGADAHKTAQNSIYWGQVIKAEKGTRVDVNPSDRFYQSAGTDFVTRDYFWQDYWLKEDRKNMPGCGAVLYTVGLGLPAGDVKINEYMYRTSSSRPDGTHVSEWGAGGYYDERTRNLPNGYYLTTDNSSELESIFKDIASQTGKPIENITIRDYISEQFELVDANGSVLGVGDTITGTGYNGIVRQDEKGIYVEWTQVTLKPEEPNQPATAKKFNETIYVQVKDGFLGGNSVPTNIGGISGVYDSEGTCIGSFPEPKVDVQIPELTLGNSDANIYYGNDAPTFKDLVTWNGTPLSELEPWQTAYVDIIETSSNTISNTEDGTYPIAVQVAPKYSAAGVGTAATPQIATATGTVNIFKLYLTYQDTTIQLGETANYANNEVEHVWKHGDTVADAITMMGTAPNLVISYDPVADAFQSDTDVTVSVTKNDAAYEGVVFGWQATGSCECTTAPTPAHFRIHIYVPEFELTITKTIQGGGTPEQDFLFWICGPNGKIPVLMTVADFAGSSSHSVTITLPSGNYTVEEDTAYSWRYEVVGADSVVGVSSEQTVTFTNKLKENDPGDKWLTGHDEINNIFDKTTSSGGASTLHNADAILPKPTVPKDDGSDEDQPDNDQPDDLPEMTNAEGGAEHV